MNKIGLTAALKKKVSWSMLRLGSRLAGRKNRLPILTFHRVLETPDPLQPDIIDEKLFKEVVRSLVSTYHVVPLREAVNKLRNSNLESGSIAITFDDGYFDNFSIALPVLLKYQAHATFFIATGYLNGGWMFNDGIIESVSKTQKNNLEIPELDLPRLETKTIDQKRNAIDKLITTVKHLRPDNRQDITMKVMRSAQVEAPKNWMMTEGHVKQLVNSGMDVGGHTKTHPILTTVSHDVAKREIEENKRELEAIVDKSVDLFAYPNGRPGKDFTCKHCLMVKEAGYKAAVSTTWAIANNKSNFFELPRIFPWDKTPERFVLRILKHTMKSNFD